KALELAEAANEFSGHNNPVILRTLAAADANAGQFSRAIEVGQLALSLTDRQSPLANALQREIAGYEASEPHREDIKRLRVEWSPKGKARAHEEYNGIESGHMDHKYL